MIKSPKEIMNSARPCRLKIKPSAAGAWHISLPMLPWRINKALKERKSIIEDIISASKSNFLWLSDWTDNKDVGWHRIEDYSTLSPFNDQLNLGAWVLAFFADPKDTPARNKFTVPSDAPSLYKLCVELNAHAAIVSWYDDIEWYLVAR
jgi:hypothetical protein